MVLQKAPEKAVLWGYALEGAQVTVFLSGQGNHQKTSPVTVTGGEHSQLLSGGMFTLTSARCRMKAKAKTEGSRQWGVIADRAFRMWPESSASFLNLHTAPKVKGMSWKSGQIYNCTSQITCEPQGLHSLHTPLSLNLTRNRSKGQSFHLFVWLLYFVSTAVFTGIWRITLDPVEAGGPYIVIAAAENSTISLTDVLFGDVWVCGGQSNMLFAISQVGRARGNARLSVWWWAHSRSH